MLCDSNMKNIYNVYITNINYIKTYNTLLNVSIIVHKMFILISSTYIFLVFCLKKCMTAFNPVKCDFIVRLYNAGQIILNLYMIYGLYINVDRPMTFRINQKYTRNIEYFMDIHYLSKIYDFCDTFFIILRKKYDQLSFLHIYHHATILIVWGFLSETGHNNGTASYGAFINSIIHLLMYTHYMITSFRIENPLKKILTHLQIIQFVTCVIHVFVVILYEDIFPKRYAYIQLFYHAIMIVLFVNFYKKKYKKSAH